MPGYNRTGPMGQGSMTGGCRGVCHPSDNTFSTSRPDFEPGRGEGIKRRNRFNRQEFRMGFGRRSGWGQAEASEPCTEDTAHEIDLLKTEATAIRQALDQISKRIKTLEKGTQNN